MRNTQYKPLFQLRLHHGYFTGGVCTWLRFAAGPVCNTLQKRFDFAMRETAGGFTWYGGVTGDTADWLRYVQQTTGLGYFDFDLPEAPVSFFGCTELPAGWAGQLLYDSNRNTGADAEGHIQLTARLSDGPAGNSLGSLRVHFDGLIARPGGGIPQYSIRFQARATQWQYYVVNKSGVHLSQPAILAKDAAPFNGPGSVVLPDGREALLFTSAQPIPLSEKPRYKYALVNCTAPGQTAGAVMVYKNLPGPNPAATTVITGGGAPQAASPMYIYL